jgi:hypothetical protein
MGDMIKNRLDCGITVDKWDNMTIEEQESFILNNNISVYFSHNIADELTRGFGELSDFGFWKYQCKKCEL